MLTKAEIQHRPFKKKKRKEETIGQNKIPIRLLGCYQQFISPASPSAKSYQAAGCDWKTSVD